MERDKREGKGEGEKTSEKRETMERQVKNKNFKRV